MVKYFCTIIISILFLTACQQEEQKQTESPPTVNVETASKEIQTSAQKHVHAAEDTATGEKFQVVESQQKCDEPIVIEFFAYQCPHCYNLEPSAAAWRKKNADKVKFHSVPWDLGNPELGSLVLVHHAAKLLGILDKAKPALFKRFHEQKKLFAAPEEAVEFLVAQGADAASAKQVLEDKEAMSQSIEADYALLSKYKITSVPQILVNHKYLTNTTAAGSIQAVFEVVDETLKLEHSCKIK